MKLSEYIDSLRGKMIAVVGIGVSNTPLLRLLLKSGCSVTACDRSDREVLGEVATELEALGAVLKLGETYLDDLQADVIFRTPGMRPDVPHWSRLPPGAAKSRLKWKPFSRSAHAKS
jgi:UDP-N-acetylmuramoylalanine--D-glutamate ligase